MSVRPMGMAGNANANDDMHFVSPPDIIFTKRDLLDVGIIHSCTTKSQNGQMLLVLLKLRRLVYEGSAYSPKTPPSIN